ncbi:MAG: hypothetical protein R3B98_07505 [Hyphomonas sp.]
MERYFPKMDSLEAVLKAIRGGGISGLVVAAMTVLGGVFIFFAGGLPGEDTYLTEEDKLYALIGVGIELLLVLLLTWRLWAGHGYVSGIILLALSLLEAVLKVTSGGAGVAWIFLYAAIAVGLFNGVRGALAYKRVKADSAAASAF